MKLIRSLKITIVSMLVLFLTVTSNAQEVGIRLGNNWGNHAAIDAVFSAGQFSRIHADLSFGGGVSAEALWNFIYKPIGTEGFQWYAGVGASIFIGGSTNNDNSSNFSLGVPGEIGLEYRFKKAPLALAMDWRPVFVLLQNTTFSAGEFGLNFRYCFGK
jgi:hypothetical protein